MPFADGTLVKVPGAGHPVPMMRSILVCALKSAIRERPWRIGASGTIEVAAEGARLCHVLGGT